MDLKMRPLRNVQSSHSEERKRRSHARGRCAFGGDPPFVGRDPHRTPLAAVAPPSGTETVRLRLRQAQPLSSSKGSPPKPDATEAKEATKFVTHATKYVAKRIEA